MLLLIEFIIIYLLEMVIENIRWVLNWHGSAVRKLDLRPSTCLVISEIGDRLWQVNYLGM